MGLGGGVKVRPEPRANGVGVLRAVMRGTQAGARRLAASPPPLPFASESLIAILIPIQLPPPSRTWVVISQGTPSRKL